MKDNCRFSNITTLPLACLLASALLWSGATKLSAQTPPPSLPPGVQDVVKLAHAGMSDDVILAQVKSAGAMYNLSADQIIYLSTQGVSQNVIKALLPSGGSTVAAPPAAPPMAPAPPMVAPANPIAPPAVPGTPGPDGTVPTPDSFHTQLSSYGSWMQLPGYGTVWQPTVALADPAWQPYCDSGHWIYTDDGWCWQSDYPWGDIAFHYGRWLRVDRSWVWIPGYDWAPAWVTWRRTDRYCGWAPLPPTAVFRAGVGLTFNGVVAVDSDFGLGEDAFTFVSYDHFWDLNFRPFVLGRARLGPIFRASIVLNGYRFDHGRLFVGGLGREAIATLTHHEVRVERPVFHDDVIRVHDDHALPGDHRDDRRPDDRRDNRLDDGFKR